MHIDVCVEGKGRPSPFEPGDSSIWTEPWTSRRLLEAQLDDSTDAASRAPAQRERAIAWIEALLPGGSAAWASGGPSGRRLGVLDLGCGPGLYAQAMAAKGAAVTGVDCSLPAIERARSRAAALSLPIDYRAGDYFACELGASGGTSGGADEGRGYDLALMIYCDFGVFSPAAASAMLGRVRSSLAEGGLFVFDVFCPSFLSSRREARSWELVEGPGFWSPKPHLVLEEDFVYPEELCACRQYLVLAEGEEPALYRTWDRGYDEEELASLLASSGFALERVGREVVAPNDFAPSGVLFAAARKVAEDMA